ncbi:hypothetical protein AT270_01630 [Bacillus cereus]|nr:hypothetical protein AT270_01630 [Bacillus cereus]MBG9937279.1 hypothetical protein [Bacillus tropicus]OTY57623.1 hypothetical protein BK748_13880 [Bacillus thuringiensis serovar graciosensis]
MGKYSPKNRRYYCLRLFMVKVYVVMKQNSILNGVEAMHIIKKTHFTFAIISSVKCREKGRILMVLTFFRILQLSNDSFYSLKYFY